MAAAKYWREGIGTLSRFRTLGMGTFSRVFALISQFVILIVLGKLLEKSAFGDFMTVFALTRVLASGLGTGPATLLVYHVSRNANQKTEDQLHRSATLLGAIPAALVTIVMLVFSAQIAGWFEKPSLAFWIWWMAPFAFFSTLLTISAGVFDGRGRIPRSILVTEFLPNLIRLTLLPPFLLLHGGNIAVAVIMILSVTIPWLFAGATLLRCVAAGFAPLTRWDVQYSSKLTLHAFAALQMQGVDMLVVGSMFSSETAADYAIASRIAALIPFFQQIIVKTLMARSGRAIHDGDHAALQAEVDRSRISVNVLVTLTAVSALLAYPILLSFMNDFSGSMALLAALAISQIVRTHWVGADALLRIAGLAGISLAIMLASGAFIVVFPLLFSKWLGIYSLPLGMFASAMILNPISSTYIYRRLGVRLSEPAIWLPILLAMIGAGICIASDNRLLPWLVGTAVILSSLAPVALKKFLPRRFANA